MVVTGVKYVYGRIKKNSIKRTLCHRHRFDRIKKNETRSYHAGRLARSSERERERVRVLFELCAGTQEEPRQEEHNPTQQKSTILKLGPRPATRGQRSHLNSIFFNYSVGMLRAALALLCAALPGGIRAFAPSKVADAKLRGGATRVWLARRRQHCTTASDGTRRAGPHLHVPCRTWGRSVSLYRERQRQRTSGNTNRLRGSSGRRVAKDEEDDEDDVRRRRRGAGGSAAGLLLQLYSTEAIQAWAGANLGWCKPQHPGHGRPSCLCRSRRAGVAAELNHDHIQAQPHGHAVCVPQRARRLLPLPRDFGRQASGGLGDWMSLGMMRQQSNTVHATGPTATAMLWARAPSCGPLHAS